MKLAFSTNAFKRYPLVESIKKIAEVGYDGVEILCDRPHAYPPDMVDGNSLLVKEAIASCGLQISNLNAFTLYAIGDVYHPSWIEDDERLRRARLEYTINCIRLASQLGARNLSTEPGGPPAPSNASRPQLERLFLDGLMTAAKEAEKEGVLLLVEPEPQLLIENSTQFKKLMREVSSDSVKLNFDIGHFHCVNEDPAKLVYELSDYIVHFHLADILNRVHNHLIPGKGEINFRSVFEAMDEIGYRGYVTVELYPYQENPVQAAQEAYGHLCKIIESMR
ncbi:MAG TPA: sugar phosphate isomerase/epimerase [Nitrososphaera sp.]|nr:sugar phosphate isomerase/epimerase [Nitrososphaera sp.]